MNELRDKIARAIMLPQLSKAEAKQVREEITGDAEISQNYMLMCGLSAGIAILGLLQSSTAVVIGAMLISPLMAPIALMGFGFASIDGRTIRDGGKVVIAGAAVGIAVGMLVTWLSPIDGATPEILARTQPSLLDLAVALLSGMAGGYAAVKQKGGTVVGVAIATALMPPLATVGYGLATGQTRYALGAFLLFLTNLAAISFAFAIIARLSGMERPAAYKKISAKYVAGALVAFLFLAIPLTISLVNITHEARLQANARDVIENVMADGSEVKQIEVEWPIGRDPTVKAIVGTTRYSANGPAEARKQLIAQTDHPVSLQVSQIVYSDEEGGEDAANAAALQRTIAGITADSPPITEIRGAIGLPTTAIWVNRGERIVSFQAVDAPGWNIANYHAAEANANEVAGNWTVRLHPPAMQELRVGSGMTAGKDAVSPDLAIWALERWGIGQVIIAAPEGSASDDLSKRIREAGIAVRRKKGGAVGLAQIQVYSPPPSAK